MKYIQYFNNGRIYRAIVNHQQVELYEQSLDMFGNEYYRFLMPLSLNQFELLSKDFACTEFETLKKGI